MQVMYVKVMMICRAESERSHSAHLVRLGVGKFAGLSARLQMRCTSSLWRDETRRFDSSALRGWPVCVMKTIAEMEAGTRK